MPLVRPQEDEFHHIEPDLDMATVGRWRVSTSYSRRSLDLRSSLKPTSLNPRFSSKAASRTPAAYRAVRLERIQEDESDDGDPTYQPRSSQVPMETNDQIDEANADAYTCPGWPPEDGLGHSRSMIPTSPTHDLANPFRFTFEHPENALSRCRRNPRNIVLDSVQPEIAPHIVVTPPEFNWADFSTMHENTVPQQQHPGHYLCVPVSGPRSLFATVLPGQSADRGVQTEATVSESEEPESGTRPDDASPTGSAGSMRVFSPSSFVRMIEASSRERDSIPHLLRPLYKRLFSACAAVTSEVALTLHSRYSSTTMSEIFSQLEIPVAWSDPASPLLSFFFRFPGTLIIDSTTPFTTPHIVITEPPIWDYNPYVNMHNSTLSPQDAEWGQSLVVPSPVVDFVNLPEDIPIEYVEPTSGCITTVQCTEPETEEDVWEPESPSEDSVVGSPESTTLQTPGLLTPIGEEEEFDLMMFSSPPQDSSLSPVGGDDLLLEDAPQDIEIYCDDEDGDLPPLDSWYQDIAARSGYVLST